MPTRDFTAEDCVFADFVVVVAHVPAAPSKPEIAKLIGAGYVIPQVGIAETAEGMEAAPFDSESIQNRVQAAAQDVALAAAADELGKHLRNVWVEVNDAIGVLGLWCLNISLSVVAFRFEATLSSARLQTQTPACAPEFGRRQ